MKMIKKLLPLLLVAHLAHADDRAAAERYFRAALETNREFPDALANLAYLSVQKQDYLRGRAFLQRYELVGPVTAEMV